MRGFLLDANVPSRIRFTPLLPIVSPAVIGPNPTDSEIWVFAQHNQLVIVTKDADFSDRMILNTPPPWVVHLRLGNMRKRDFHAILSRQWQQVETLLKTHKLVNVYRDRVEGVH